MQKRASELRQLRYGVSLDDVEEYVRISKSMSYTAIISKMSTVYPRHPSVEYFKRIEALYL